MATNLDTYDQLARIQELYLALNGNDGKASQEAMRELSGMGFNVEQDPGGAPPPAAPKAPDTSDSHRGILAYRVDRSDNIETIATQFNTTPDHIREMNRLPSGSTLKHGDEIMVPAMGAVSVSSYIVSPGKNSLLRPQQANSGSLSQRPATPVGAQGFGDAAKYYKGIPKVGGARPGYATAKTTSDAATRGAVLGATAPATAAAPAPVSPGVVAEVPAGRSAFSMGAPAMDDRVDGSGRAVPGTQTFVRNLFATADNANKALAMYKKQNPNANSQNDPQHRALELAVSSAVNDSNAGSKWAGMTPSARQSVLTQGELASGRAKAVDMTQQGALEQRQAESERAFAGLPSNLLEDGQYFRDTGVMRGGAGVGTSTTRAGGVISPDSTTGGLALESPYGKGSAVFLNPHEQARRPEAKIEGMPASQYFDKAAMRQGRTFDVGDKHYSPELSPEDFKQKQLDEAKRKAEEARKKFAASILKR